MHEESTIEGLIGVLKSLHTPKTDILCMDLYYKEEHISSCDYCKKLGATHKTPDYGSVFKWCNESCFNRYLKKTKRRGRK